MIQIRTQYMEKKGRPIFFILAGFVGYQTVVKFDTFSLSCKLGNGHSSLQSNKKIV